MKTRLLGKLPKLTGRGWQRIPAVLGFAPYFYQKRQEDRERVAWIVKWADGQWRIQIES